MHVRGGRFVVRPISGVVRVTIPHGGSAVGGVSAGRSLRQGSARVSRGRNGSGVVHGVIWDSRGTTRGDIVVAILTG